MVLLDDDRCEASDVLQKEACDFDSTMPAIHEVVIPDRVIARMKCSIALFAFLQEGLHS